jgi:7-keto-8-aminopelargonate synthetase-like enzyme
LFDNHGYLRVNGVNGARRDPAVPKGTERLRFTPSPLHSDADLDHLMRALFTLWSHCALSRAVA